MCVRRLPGGEERGRRRGDGRGDGKGGGDVVWPLTADTPAKGPDRGRGRAGACARRYALRRDAAEPRDAAGERRRRPGARARLRQPRLPARRGRPHPPPFPGQALDRVPARVPRPAAEPLLQPGRYTELFFLDEATAFAAGHRPCAECRRDDYGRFSRSGRTARPAPTRWTRGCTPSGSTRHAAQRPTRRRSTTLPDGAFVLRRRAVARAAAASCCAGRRPVTTTRAPRPRGDGGEITPPSLVAVLRAGWEPASSAFLHAPRGHRQGGFGRTRSLRRQVAAQRRQARVPARADALASSERVSERPGVTAGNGSRGRRGSTRRAPPRSGP